jgi:branched-chain amino acid transport system permease protein
VVGGLGSLLGAGLGSLYLEGSQWWLPGAQWQTLASAVGVLLVLMIIPGGIGDLVYRGRDAALRYVALRRGLIVPSLVADTRGPDAERRPSDSPRDAQPGIAGPAPVAGTGQDPLPSAGAAS